MAETRTPQVPTTAALGILAFPVLCIVALPAPAGDGFVTTTFGNADHSEYAGRKWVTEWVSRHAAVIPVSSAQ